MQSDKIEIEKDKKEHINPNNHLDETKPVINKILS